MLAIISFAFFLRAIAAEAVAEEERNIALTAQVDAEVNYSAVDNLVLIRLTKPEEVYYDSVMSLHPYLRPLQTLLEQHADPAAAVPMSAYMRDQFAFLGIKTPQRVALLKQFYAERGLPPLAELDPILRDLWSLPQREYQYVAVGMLGKFARQLPPDFIRTMEYLITTKSWWDTVDSISGSVGIHFQRYPHVKAEWLAKWRQSDNFWLRRVTILFQLGYKKNTDFPLMCDIIRENLGSNEFFINKAIGWALRQYSREDAQAVRDFVAATPLHPLSAREALKWLENQEKKIGIV